MGFPASKYSLVWIQVIAAAMIETLIGSFIASKIYHHDFGYERAQECIQESVDELGLGMSSLSGASSRRRARDKRLLRFVLDSLSNNWEEEADRDI